MTKPLGDLPIGVLIRADGGVGLPALPRNVTTTGFASGSLLAVIDFRDEHHPALRRRSGERKAAYAAAGWTLVDDIGPTPLERFLAARPFAVLPEDVR